MPTWGCARTLRRAVESVLEQTYDDLTLVVVNDGDSPSMWGTISDIEDPRLVRFDLPINRGRYYADAVSLAACSTPWFAVHDADDWSEPQWLQELIAQVVSDGAVAAFSPQILHHGGRIRKELVHPQLTARATIPQMTQLAHHAGVYRTEAIRASGGYHPGYRIGWDTMLVNLVRMVGPCGATLIPRYHRVTRFGSLTTSRQTGLGSPARAAVKRQLQEFYQAAIGTPPEHLAGMVRSSITPSLIVDVAGDSVRLRSLLGGGESA